MPPANETTANQTTANPEELRAENHDLIDRVDDRMQAALNALLRAYDNGTAAAAGRYAEALRAPGTRAEWDAIAEEAEADVAAGRVYSDAEVGEYLEGVAAGAERS